MAAKERGGRKRFGLLEAGAHRLGVDTRFLSEVCVLHRLLPFVSDRPEVIGAFDLRGSIIPVVDSQMLCGLPRCERNPPVAAVLEHDNRLVALGVDRAAGISEFDEGAIQVYYDPEHQSNLPVRSGLMDDEGNVSILEPLGIFGRPGLPSCRVNTRAVRKAALAGAQTYLTFEVGAATFGLDAIRIYGTVPRQTIPASAMTSKACLGEIRYHKRRIPVLNSACALGLGTGEMRSDPEVVVMQLPEGRLIGFAVDFIRRIRLIPQESERPSPKVLSGTNLAISRVLVEDDGRQTFILDPDILASQAMIVDLAALSDPELAVGLTSTECRTVAKGGPSSDKSDRLRSEAAQNAGQLLVFSADSQMTCILTEVTSILEKPGTITPTNGRDAGLLGLFAHLGETMPLVDLGRYLFGSDPIDPGSGRVLIVSTDAAKVGFLVSSVDGIGSAEIIKADTDAEGAPARVVRLKNRDYKGFLNVVDLTRIAEDVRMTPAMTG